MMKKRTRLIFVLGGVILLALAFVLVFARASSGIVAGVSGAGLAAIIASFFVEQRKISR